MTAVIDSRASFAEAAGQDGRRLPTPGEVLAILRRRLGLLILAPLAVGALAYGAASLIPPTFTANTSFIPPQQAQSTATSALASLGALGGLVGGAANLRSSADQYVAILQSATVSDRIIEQFGLMAAYEAKFRVDARKLLGTRVRIAAGKKDGLISVSVDDTVPQRAADIANRYVDELRRINATLAVTEAQRRRLFFEQQLQLARDRLIKAQTALQGSGFNSGALKADPKSSAEGYARLKAELVAAEVRLQTLRGNFADGTAEVRQQQTAIAAIRGQLDRTEEATAPSGGADYITRYREFKYQETLFELYARQFELARVDESNEGALIQVVDKATPPERKSKPNRALITLSAALVSALLLMVMVVLRAPARQPEGSD